MEIKNKHLKEVIHKIDCTDIEEMSTESYYELYGELIFSKMYCPFKDYEHVLDDNDYVEAFTTYDEFIQYFDESEMEIYDFDASLLYLNEDDGNGAIINPGTDNLKLPNELLRYMRLDYLEPRWYSNRKSKHIPKNIKKLKKIKNTSLNNYLKQNDINLKKLLEEIILAKTFVLFKDENAKVKKGIVEREEYDYYVDNEGYGCLFTSWEEVEKTGLSDVYVTIPIPEFYFRYILMNDYEGVKVNNDIILPRKFLIREIELIVKYSYHKNKMDNYSRYGLKIR